MEGPLLGPYGEDITWPAQVAPRGRKASSTRKIKPQTSNHSDSAVVYPCSVPQKARNRPTVPFQLPLRSMRNYTWHKQSSRRIKNVHFIIQFHKKQAPLMLQLNTISCQHSAAHATRAYQPLRANPPEVRIFGCWYRSAAHTFLFFITSAVPSCKPQPSLLGSEASGDHSMKTGDAGGVTRQAHAFASRIHKCSICCIFNIICAPSVHHSMYIQIPRYHDDALCLCLFNGAKGTLELFLGGRFLCHCATLQLGRPGQAITALSGRWGYWCPYTQLGGSFGVLHLSFSHSQRLAVAGAAL